MDDEWHIIMSIVLKKPSDMQLINSFFSFKQLPGKTQIIISWSIIYWKTELTEKNEEII